MVNQTFTAIQTPTSRLAGFYFLYFALIGAFMPYWGLYLEHLGLTKYQIGELAFIGVMTRIVAPSIWGYISDKTGKRMRWVQLGALMQCVGWLLICTGQTTYGAIALILLFTSFFQNAILAQFEVVTLFWLKAEQSKYGAIRKWGSIGFIVAVLALGYVFDLISIGYLPYLLAVLSGLTLINGLLIAEPVIAKENKVSAPLWSVLAQTRVWSFYLVILLILYSHAPFYSFYSNYLKDYHYSTRMIGGLWSVGVFAEIIMFMCAERLFKRYSDVSLMQICVVFTAFRWCVVALFPEYVWIQVGAQLIHAFSFALLHLLAMRFIGREFALDQQGRAQAIYNMLWGVGVALGSVMAGAVWESIGGHQVFFIAGGVALFASLVVTFTADRKTIHVP